MLADHPAGRAIAERLARPGNLAAVAAVPDSLHQISEQPTPAFGFLDAARQLLGGFQLARVIAIVNDQLPRAIDRRHLALLQQRLDVAIAAHGQRVGRKMPKRFIPAIAVGFRDRVQQGTKRKWMRDQRFSRIQQIAWRFGNHESAPKLVQLDTPA